MQGAGKMFVGVVQPSEKSFAVAIVVDATCSIRAPPQHSGRAPQAQEREGRSDKINKQLVSTMLKWPERQMDQSALKIRCRGQQGCVPYGLHHCLFV